MIQRSFPALFFLAMICQSCDHPDRSATPPPTQTIDSVAAAADVSLPDTVPTGTVMEDSSDRRYFADINPSLKQDPVVLAYLRKHVVKRPEHMRFIELREKRRSIAVARCDETMIAFGDSLPSGNSYFITITSKPFDSASHRIGRAPSPDARWVQRLDGKPFYGTDGDLPRKEISSYTATINGNQIRIPKSAYSQFYDLNFCSYFGGDPYVEAYESSDGKHLYIYMEASDGAGAYSVKMVFDHTAWITSMAGRLDFSGNAMMDGLNEMGITQSDVNAPVDPE